jgi:hypothetical protein
MNNPRPPSGFFETMRPKIKKQYPRRSKAIQDKIIAGIFYNYPEETRAKIIKQYDTVKVNPKVEMLECPCCHAKNPVSKEGVYLKCGKCKKNLVSVKIKRK